MVLNLTPNRFQHSQPPLETACYPIWQTTKNVIGKPDENSVRDIQYMVSKQQKRQVNAVLVMTSPVIIFAVFLRRRRSFIQQMRLMSLQMRKMLRNLLILSIQQRNNSQCHNWDKGKTRWVYPRPQFWFKDLAEEMENPMRYVGL